MLNRFESFKHRNLIYLTKKNVKDLSQITKRFSIRLQIRILNFIFISIATILALYLYILCWQKTKQKAIWKDHDKQTWVKFN